MFSPSSAVPQTMFSPSSTVPQTMFSHLVGDGAPHDVLAVVSAERAPDDVLALVVGERAPDDVGGPGVGGRLQHAALDAVIAPDDLTAPHPRMRVRLSGLRALEVARELDGALRVQEAGALRQRVVVPRLRGVLKDRLHQVRLERRVRLEHQRDGAGNDRRRHAGAAQAQVRPARREPGALEQDTRPWSR